MNDYISRQAAIDSIWDGTNYDIYTKEVKEHLEELPPADVRENVKAYWNNINDKYYSCSYCGGCADIAYHYCPWCGADMRGAE